jgi:hypothetical protein
MSMSYTYIQEHNLEGIYRTDLMVQHSVGDPNSKQCCMYTLQEEVKSWGFSQAK